MIGFEYTVSGHATLRTLDPLAGVDWCWVSTTTNVATNLPTVIALRTGEPLGTRVVRGTEFAFSRYERLLRRLAD